jgi:hypothetical protein
MMFTEDPRTINASKSYENDDWGLVDRQRSLLLDQKNEITDS